ncbi:MAG: pyridoxine 5'-phosphate synthase [Bdellovibrionales bacterium]|nr:pyridoxine 5'-phosphate synthase [Bdellovibrionales bacterium]
MTKLSVNINKLATLRNSRGKNQPNLLYFGKKILEWGAHGLTVHPRPDARHIKKQDVIELHQLVQKFNLENSSQTEFNVEGYPSADFLNLVDSVRPHQVTLVPDKPEALTSQAGWEISNCEKLLHPVITQLQKSGIRVSLFIDPNSFTKKDLDVLTFIRPDRVELYTEKYADNFGTSMQQETLENYKICAQKISTIGIGLNAGHDLNKFNLYAFLQSLPQIDEVSIGHALICESLEEGLCQTVKCYLKILSSTNLL